jgi:hypothetical protein
MTLSEVIETAGAASPDAASVLSPSERVARATAIMGGQPAPETAAPTAKTATPAPEAKSDTPESLAAVIRAQREARQAAQAEAHKRTGLESELKAAREELARVKADRQAFEDDPVAFAKDRGWTKDQQLLYGKSLLFDLAPDKADPDFRIKMFEDRQKREKAQQEKEHQTAAEKEAAEAQQRQLEGFFQDTAKAVQDFSAGSYPESEAWFEGDYQSYMKSIMATATNLAQKATKLGQVADLTPAALAAALEAEVAAKMARRDQRKQALTTPAVKPTPQAAASSGAQAAETMSTRNMSGGGAPTPPASSDKERIQRAIAAGFRQR